MDFQTRIFLEKSNHNPEFIPKQAKMYGTPRRYLLFPNIHKSLWVLTEKQLHTTIVYEREKFNENLMFGTEQW